MTAILAVPLQGVGVCVGSDRRLSGNPGEPVAQMGTPKSVRCGAWIVALAGEIGGVWDDLARIPAPATLSHLLDAIGDGPGAEGVIANGDRLWSLYWDSSAGRWGACQISSPAGIGSGGAFAFGAYIAQRAPRAPGWRSVERRVIRALQLTGEWITDVGGPYDVIWSSV